MFFILKKMDKVVGLVGGGSVINGAYPIKFFWVYKFEAQEEGVQVERI